ncbi:MAG: CocE/NonD family hydrolase [Pseudomonadota bacterium]
MLRSALRSGQLFRPQCKTVEPDQDIHCQYDVQIPMREGYSLTCNIFRSKTARSKGRAMPVIMCAHPYDNHLTQALGKTLFGGPPQQYRLIGQAGGMPQFSTLTSWESPDPDFWVPAGYTLVNMNLPGYSNSGGPGTIVSAHQARCYREAIEWVGDQEWCDGNVGLNGVSYLAITQCFAASAPANDIPKALKCISPWEGFTNTYHDLACGGGVADTTFLNFWWHTEVKGPLNTSLEDFLELEEAIPPDALSLHPFYDEFWKNKTAKLEDISVPMLVCGSFSDHELHTMGSFRAFERASSDRKWLYTHRGGKWTTFYAPEVQALTKDFMDHFLKGQENQFSNLPPVRLEVRSSRNEVHEVRWEQHWPLPQTTYTPLYLSDGALASNCPANPTEVQHAAKDGLSSFDFVFQKNTELSGYMKLKLHVEVRPERPGAAQPEDMILCVYVDKLDRKSAPVRFNGSVGQENDVLTRGYIRVSRRTLDETASSPWLPVYDGTSEHPIGAAEIVPVEIAMRPSSTFFFKGEGLRLIVSPHDIYKAPIFGKDTRLNAGQHVLHYGGDFDAHLLVPLIT